MMSSWNVTLLSPPRSTLSGSYVFAATACGQLVPLLTVALLVALAGCEPPPLTESGVVGVFGHAGAGPGDFAYPRAIAIDHQGRAYVVDKSARVQRFDADGTLEKVWHMPQMAAGKPVGLHASDDGRLFVADTHYHRVVVYDFEGQELARFGEPGNGDGQFQLPTDVDVDHAGNIYVSEYNGNDRVTKWSSDYRFLGEVVVGEVAGQMLRRPAAIDIDDEQTLWVADACNHRILRLTLDGELLAAWGEMGRAPGQMRYPYDIACLPNGQILVCEFGNDRIQWFDREGRSLRVWGTQGRQLGDLWAPWGAAMGKKDRIYVVDSQNARVQIIRP